MMRWFAEFVMRSRNHAIVLATATAFIPFFSWISLLIIGLVALRRTLQDALIVAAWSTIPTFVYAVLLPQARFEFLLVNLVYGVALTLLLAAVLRNTYSWSAVLTVCSALGVVAVSGLHFMHPNINEEWVSLIRASIQHVAAVMPKQSVEPGAVLEVTASLAGIATGLQAVMVLMCALANLLFSRLMQAKLYNPGGLREELRAVRLNVVDLGILAIVAAMTFFFRATAIDLLPVALIPFVFAGIAAVHRFANQRKKSRLFIYTFYIFLSILFMQMILVLVLISIVDLIQFNRGNRDGSYSIRKSS